MTDDERQEAERVCDAVIEKYNDAITHRCGTEEARGRAVEVIAAARVRWQNEAIDRMRDAAKSAVYFGLGENELHKARAICAQIETEARALKK